MATKINPDFYGADNTFANVDNNGNIKHAASTLWDLLDAGKYTGGSLEQTAAPWGMGRSSASSLYCFAAANDSGAYARKDWYNDKGNTPLYMYYRSTIAQGEDSNGNGDIAYFTTSALDGAQIKKGLQTARYNLTAAGTSNRLDSTLSEDSGDNVNYAYCSTLYPVTYADYAKIRIYCGAVCYIPDGQQFIKYCTIEDIINNNVSVKNIVGFLMYVVNTDDRNNYHYVYPTGGGTELPVPEGHKTYYGDNGRVQPWRRIDTMGFFCPYNWYNTSDHYYPNFSADKMPPASAFDDITTFDPQFTTLTSLNMYNWGHVSPKKQVFDDVSYHWEVGIVPFSIDYQDFDVLADGTTLMGTDYRIAGKLVIDDSTYNTTNEAVTAAIMHELAFIGFPIAKTYSDCNAAIGTNGILLPVFDEHLITTGDYVSGSDSLALPNASWRDVFGATMPDYDPNYNPDPEPDEGDTGNLNNKGLYTNRFSNHAYTIWALYGTSLSNNGLDAIIAAINDLYITDPDGNSKWQLDFKGTNPTDYIVGLYAYPLDFKVSDNSYPFVLGPVEFDTINVKKYADDGYFSFGVIDLSYDSDDVTWYGDFRDYPPYSCAELYIPFCGTYDIDLAFFIGHTMEIIGYYDIYTGALSCAIYRDSKTLYKTVNGQIGVQLPLTSTRAGDYQNNIHSLEVALKQNDIRLATSAITLGASAVTAIATGGASLAVGAGAIGGLSTLASALTERDNIEYKISHTQPVPAQTGAAETQNGYRVGGIYPKLYIKRAKKLSNYDPIIYSHTIGNACCINDIIGNMSGLTVCSKIDTSGINATVEEIQAIKQAFANGVYV